MQTTIKRHPERSVNEEYSNILKEGLVAHVGFIQDSIPYIIPMSYQYDISEPNIIYLHGSPESRMLEQLSQGETVCIEVTLLDGLVYSKTALYHSMNYKSVICFGKGKEINNLDKKTEILTKMIGRYFQGRTEKKDYDTPPVAHINTTKVIEISIESFNAKARQGGPKGSHDTDINYPGTSGVIDLKTK